MNNTNLDRRKSDLQARLKQLSKSTNQELVVPIFVSVYGHIIESSVTLEVGWYWDNGMSPCLWVNTKNMKDSADWVFQELFDKLCDHLTKEIAKFCDDVDQFKADGGDVSWCPWE